MTRIQTLQSKLPEDSCAVISSDINRRYFTGMKSSAGTLIVFPKAAYLLIDFRYIEKAKDTVKDCEVEETKKLFIQLYELIVKHKAERVWIESNTMTISEFDRLKAGIINASVKSAGAEPQFNSSDDLSIIIRNMRSIKSKEEISLMIKAQRIAEAALENTLNFIREGVTEKEIALYLNDCMLRNGAEDLSFETIALCGASTSMPHGVPSDKPLKAGEPILMDFGAVFEGYHSDMTRTVVLGEPDSEFEKIYFIVLEAQQRALSCLRSGITGKELDSAARSFIAKSGYGEYFGHGLGHSVGMEIHEYPNANTSSDAVLTENCIITVEPGIYIPKKFGVRIEDFAVVKANGCENLTLSPKNLIKL